jgi:hypothetical protein
MYTNCQQLKKKKKKREKRERVKEKMSINTFILMHGARDEW